MRMAPHIIVLSEPLEVPADTTIRLTDEGSPTVALVVDAETGLVLAGDRAEVRGLFVFGPSDASTLVSIEGAETVFGESLLSGGGIGIKISAETVVHNIIIGDAADAAIVSDAREGLPIVAGALIGLLLDLVPAPNGDGIRLEGGALQVGLPDALVLIGHNAGDGIKVTDAGAELRLHGGLIGVDEDSNPIPNAGHGISVGAAARIELGGEDCPFPCNFIAANGGHGLDVVGAADVVVAGNLFGAGRDADKFCVRAHAGTQLLSVGPRLVQGVPTDCVGACNVFIGCAAGVRTEAAENQIRGNFFGTTFFGVDDHSITSQNIFVEEGNVVIEGNVMSNAGREAILLQGPGVALVGSNHIGVNADGVSCPPPIITDARQSGLAIAKGDGSVNTDGNTIGCLPTDPATAVAYGIHLASAPDDAVRVDMSFVQDRVGLGVDDLTVLPIANSSIGVFAGSASFTDVTAVSEDRFALVGSSPGVLAVERGTFVTGGDRAIQLDEGFGHSIEGVMAQAEGSYAIRASGAVTFALRDSVQLIAPVDMIRLAPAGGFTPNLGLAAPVLNTGNEGGAGLVNVTGTATPGARVDVYEGLDGVMRRLVSSCAVDAQGTYDCGGLSVPDDATRVYAIQRANLVYFEIVDVTTSVTFRVGNLETQVVRQPGEPSNVYAARVIAELGVRAFDNSQSPDCTAGGCVLIAIGGDAELSVDGTVVQPAHEIVSQVTTSQRPG